MNLLQETLEILERNGKTPDDVYYISNVDEYMFWEEFEEEAKDIEYDSGYGLPEIAVNLKVVGLGGEWWLERHEYDGAEWWVFRETPTKPEVNRRFDLLYRWDAP